MKSSHQEWSIYVLRCSDGSFYTGATNCVANRLKKHNSGKGAKYTRARLPCILIDSCIVGTKSNALKAEARFKKQNRSQKIESLRLGLDVFVQKHLELSG